METEIIVPDDIWTPVLSWSYSLTPGIWFVSVSSVIGHDGNIQDAEVRYTGTYPSPVFGLELDAGFNIPFNYSFHVEVLAPGVQTLVQEVMKEGNPGTLTVLTANISAHKVG